MPILSIIIPVYNAELHLANCLDSLLCQNVDDYEIVLIDDGSTDHSGFICEDYARKHNNISVIHQINNGVSCARNKGLDVAKGDYICFVDADDQVASNYLSVLTTYARSSQPADITFFSMNIIDKNGKKEIVNLKDVYCEDRSSVETCIFSLRYGGERDVFGWTWDKMFYASIIREHDIHFPEKIQFREDELFTFDFCRYISSLRIINLPLYNYRVSGNGLTGKGMRPADYLPSSIALESHLVYYQDEGLREHMLHSITSYRALHIYKNCPIQHLKQNLEAYQQLTKRYPQSGKTCPIQHLTQYLKKGYWVAYIYCLIRKL